MAHLVKERDVGQCGWPWVAHSFTYSILLVIIGPEVSDEDGESFLVELVEVASLFLRRSLVGC